MAGREYEVGRKLSSATIVLSKMPSRYLAITQEPYCYVPTTLLMILLRRGLPLIQIADIG